MTTGFEVAVEDDDLNLRRDFLGPNALLILTLLTLKNKNYNRKHSILITFKMMKEFFILQSFMFYFLGFYKIKIKSTKQ